MSGCVTLTGPPASICAWKIGTTLPLLPRTLPKRTDTHFISRPLLTGRAETIRSQTRLVAPITLVGFTALSEEIIRKLRTPCRRDSQTRFQVPSTLACAASRRSEEHTSE